MVAVVVRNQDRTHRPPGDRGDQRVEVSGIVRAGIDHRQIGSAHQMRLRAGVGVGRRIGGEHPRHQRFEPDRGAGGRFGHRSQMAAHRGRGKALRRDASRTRDAGLSGRFTLRAMVNRTVTARSAQIRRSARMARTMQRTSRAERRDASAGRTFPSGRSAPPGARIGQPLAAVPWNSSASSPLSYISIMMSDPPTNSPFTYSCGMVGQSENALIP